MMRKTLAPALFLLSGMAWASLPLAGRAEAASKDYSAAATKTTDSLYYQQELDVIQDKIPLTFNRYVQKYIDLYTRGQKTRFSRVIGLSKYYFPIYEKVLKERNVPEDLKYISVIESSLDPNAVSHAGATGLWQFMYETGKIYGLTIDDWTDERKDPARACNAAASYLLDSYFLYDDWLLAIASYNCGRNNIRWAIEKAGGQKDFWAIRQYLPVETQNYVPAFIATAYVMNNYRKYGITPEEPAFTVNTSVLPVTTTVSLRDIAGAAGISPSELNILNAKYEKQLIRGSEDAPMDVIVPFSKRNTALEGLLNAGKQDSSAIAGIAAAKNAERPFIHRVAPGETLPSIAGRYSVSPKEIITWNNLGGQEVAAGKVLRILSDRIPALKQINDGYVSYTVKQGDTLSSIAQKFNGATAEEIKVINRLSESGSVRPGMILKIIGG